MLVQLRHYGTGMVARFRVHPSVHVAHVAGSCTSWPCVLFRRLTVKWFNSELCRVLDSSDL